MKYNQEPAFHSQTKEVTSSSTDNSAGIRAEQIKLLFQQSKTAFLATLLLAPILVLILWDNVPRQWLFGWLAAIYLLTLARFFLVWCYFRKSPSIAESATWGRLFILGVFLSGILWGTAGGLFFVYGNFVQQVFLAYILGGLVAGAMSTLSSYKGTFLIFSLPVTLPYTYQALMHGSNDLYIAIAATYLLFAFMMAKISQHLYDMITHSLRLRFDNFDLVNSLLRAKERQNKFNQQLQTQIAEKEQAEKALQHINNQLEQRVTERTEALAQSNAILQQEKELFRTTLASISDAVITVDSAGKLTYLNPAAELLTGWNNSEVQGAPLHQVFHIVDIFSKEPILDSLNQCLNITGKNSANQECLLIQKNQHKTVIDYSIAPIRDAKQKVIGAVLTFRDVTEQRKLTQKLAYKAAHDPLTGLLNREQFETRLGKVLAATHQGHSHALLFLDLDQFKVVNDTCGHSAGDELLRQVTTLLHANLRTRDTLARLGGDEFGIILEHCPQKEALRIAHTLREIVQNFRFQWQNRIFTIGVSIGLFPITQGNENLAKVMQAVDSACYAAKEKGRNQVHVYQTDDSLLQRKSAEMQWLSRIQHAMSENRLHLYFQPILPISKEKKYEQNGELLLRFQDEQGQLILPGAFLPAIERHEKMVMIDRWVVLQSLKLLNAVTARPTKVTYSTQIFH